MSVGDRAQDGEHGRRSAAMLETVLSTDYGRWSDGLRRLAVPPLSERVVPLSELRAFVAGNPGARISWSVPDIGQPVFPKIAVVSWKCFPWVLPVTPGIDLAHFCSERMRTVLRHWLDASVEPVLRFFPVVDFNDVVELRFRLSRGLAKLERGIGRGGATLNATTVERALGLVRQVQQHADEVCVDVAVPTRSERAPWLIELNPQRRYQTNLISDRMSRRV